MIEIKNTSNEPIEILTSIDPTIRGCRIKKSEFTTQRLDPGQSLRFLGYEPGVLLTIRPVEGYDTPRSFL